MIEEIKGNLLKTDCELIAHGVNCQGKMGSGVAKALYTKWPIVKQDYLKVCNEMFAHGTLPEHLLGHVVPSVCTDEKTVINCFTQQNYGYDGQIYLNYKAVKDCMMKLKAFMDGYGTDQIAMPKIGCGLAGGDWEIVREIIESVFGKGQKYIVKVYYL